MHFFLRFAVWKNAGCFTCGAGSGSDLESTGSLRNRFRLLQSPGAAFGTGAYLAQQVECIDSRIVLIAPFELESIVAYQNNVGALQS